MPNRFEPFCVMFTSKNPTCGLLRSSVVKANTTSEKFGEALAVWYFATEKIG